MYEFIYSVQCGRSNCTAHFTSCVSNVDDFEDNTNAGSGDKTTNAEEDAASDVAEGNIQKIGVSVTGCFCISSYMIWIHILNESIYSLLFEQIHT
jgi:hypothetical protein